MRSMGQTAMSTENAQKIMAEGGPAGASATQLGSSTVGGGTSKSLLGTKKRTSKPAYL